MTSHNACSEKGLSFLHLFFRPHSLSRCQAVKTKPVPLCWHNEDLCLLVCSKTLLVTGTLMYFRSLSVYRAHAVSEYCCCCVWWRQRQGKVAVISTRGKPEMQAEYWRWPCYLSAYSREVSGSCWRDYVGLKQVLIRPCKDIYNKLVNYPDDVIIGLKHQNDNSSSNKYKQ